METITFTGELTILSCWCGIEHAVPTTLRTYQLNERDAGRSYGIYCPLGHQHVPSGETRAQKLERELQFERNRLASARASHDQTRAALRDTEKRLSAQKGVTTRIKNRVKAGVCPCCNRTFANLAAHMKGQHPTFAKVEDHNA